MTCIKCKKELPSDSIYCMYCGKKQVGTPKKKSRRPRGSGSIYIQKGKRKKPYVAQIYNRDSDGVLQKIAVGYYTTKADAQIALDNVLKNGLPDMHRITIEEAFEKWSASHFSTLSDSGVQSYASAWTYFGSVKNMKLSDIKTDHIQSIIDQAKQSKSRAVCEKIKQLASQLCKWGMANDLVQKNYAEFVKLPPNDTKAKETFSSQDLARMFSIYEETKDKKLGAIILMCFTGFRLTEFLNLKKTDFENGCIKGGSKTEKGKNRIVPILDFVLPILTDLMDNPSDYIYPNMNGVPHDKDNYRNRIFYPTLEKYSLPKLSPHATRHTYASLGVMAGIQPKAMQDILGHENFDTTASIYAHTNNEWLAEEAKKIKKPE